MSQACCCILRHKRNTSDNKFGPIPHRLQPITKKHKWRRTIDLLSSATHFFKNIDDNDILLICHCLQPFKKKQDDDKPGRFIIVFYGNVIKQKDNDELGWLIIVYSPSTRPKKQQWTRLACCCLSWNLQRMKMMMSQTCCFLSAWTKKKWRRVRLACHHLHNVDNTIKYNNE